MNRDVLSYGVILAGSIFFMIMTAYIPLTGASLVSSAFFPRLILGMLIVLSAIGLHKARKEGGAVKKNAKIHAPFFIIVGLAVGFIVLLNLAGFVIATSSFIFATSLYMYGEYNPKIMAVLAAFALCIAFGVHYVFTEVLMFILP